MAEDLRTEKPEWMAATRATYALWSSIERAGAQQGQFSSALRLETPKADHSTAANGLATRVPWEGMRDPKLGFPVPAGVDTARIMTEASQMSYREWYNAVKSHGKWDFKTQDRNFQYFGNYAFGFAAKGKGFSSEFARFGAGMYQIKSGTSKWEWYPSDFDDPIDSSLIASGHDKASEISIEGREQRTFEERGRHERIDGGHEEDKTNYRHGPF